MDLDFDLESIDKPAVVVDKSSDYVFVDNILLNNFSKAYDVKVYNMFYSKDLMMNIMNIIAIHNNFEFNTLRSCKTRVYFRCVKDWCTWLFRASTLNENCDMLKITCYVNTHSCLLDVHHNQHKQVSCYIISAYVKSFYPDEAALQKSCPGDIVSLMLRKYGVTVSYYKAWQGRELALI